MKRLASRLAALGFVALLGAGCAAPQMMQQTGAAPEREPGTSLLDLQWVNPAMKFATQTAQEKLPSARIEAPGAYSEEQRGRVSLEGAPTLPPLTAPEMWHPQPETIPPLDLKTPARAPLPNLPQPVDVSKPPVTEDSDG